MQDMQGKRTGPCNDVRIEMTTPMADVWQTVLQQNATLEINAQEMNALNVVFLGQ